MPRALLTSLLTALLLATQIDGAWALAVGEPVPLTGNEDEYPPAERQGPVEAAARNQSPTRNLPSREPAVASSPGSRVSVGSGADRPFAPPLLYVYMSLQC